jgi:adenine phosphoribosyltransferase
MLEKHIRTIPNWPSPGITFRDITPLLRDGEAFNALIERFAERYAQTHIDAVAGIDARGFIIGAALSYRLGCGFIPIRKAGKLPFETMSESYTLEYGQATIEVHTDAAAPGDHVLVIDDLIATGGTMLATTRLMQRLGAKLVEAAAVIDLPELGGSTRLEATGVKPFTLMSF